MKDIINIALNSLNPDSQQGTIVSSDFVSVGSAFGTIFLEEIVALSLPEGMNYQTYCLTDTFFQGYYSLSLNNPSEIWFNDFKSEIHKEEVVILCKLLSNELFRLFEESLMEQNKTRVSFQLNILEYLQGDGIDNVLKNASPTFKENKKCILILFIFLSKKLLNKWLPYLINVHKQKMLPTVATTTKKSVFNVDGEVNRIVGWALFATLKKYQKIAQKNDKKNMRKVNEVIEMLHDIQAQESDILQDSEYVKKYYCVDDAIRNKGRLTLIARPYIKDLSILSRFLSQQYKSPENLRVNSQNVKRNVIKELTQGSHLSYINALVNTSILRIEAIELKNEDRVDIFLQILNRVSNAKIGYTIKHFRTENLTRVNDVKFRTQLAVLSVKKEKGNEKNIDSVTT